MASVFSMKQQVRVRQVGRCEERGLKEVALVTAVRNGRERQSADPKHNRNGQQHGAIGNSIPWNFGSPIPSTVQFFSFIFSCLEEGRKLCCYKVLILPVNENEGQWERN